MGSAVAVVDERDFMDTRVAGEGSAMVDDSFIERPCLERRIRLAAGEAATSIRKGVMSWMQAGLGKWAK